MVRGQPVAVSVSSVQRELVSVRGRVKQIVRAGFNHELELLDFANALRSWRRCGRAECLYIDQNVDRSSAGDDVSDHVIDRLPMVCGVILPRQLVDSFYRGE